MAYRDVVLADNPTSYWRLDEAPGAGSAVDVLGVNNLTYTAATLGTGGLIGGDPDTAVTFNGTTSQANPGATTYNPAAYSWEAWVQVLTMPGVSNGRVFGLRAGGTLDGTVSIASTGALNVYVFDGAAQNVLSAAGLITARTVHHIVMTTDNGGPSTLLYVDGVLQASMAKAHFTGYAAANLQIGGQGSGNDPSTFLNAVFDEVAFYQLILTPAQIAAHYAAGAAATVPRRLFLPRNTLRRGVRDLGQTALFLARVPKAASPTGPASLVATGADTSLSSDTATRVIAVSTTASDTSASSDSATRVDSLRRTGADTSASSDTATRAALSFARTAADTSLSSDSASRVEREPRSASDTSLSSDAAIATKGYARSASDTSLSSDTATRAALSFARTTTDTSASSDSASRVLRLPRSGADTSTSSDASTRTLAPARTTGDTSLSSDASVRSALHFIRTAADTSSSSDHATSVGPAPSQPPTICYPTSALVVRDRSDATASLTRDRADASASVTRTGPTSAVIVRDRADAAASILRDRADASASVTRTGPTSGSISRSQTSGSIIGPDTAASIKTCGIGP